MASSFTNNRHWKGNVSDEHDYFLVCENVRIDDDSDDDDEDDDDDDAANDGVKDDDGEARGAVDDEDYDEDDDDTDAGADEDEENVNSDDAYADMTMMMMTREFPLFRSPFLIREIDMASAVLIGQVKSAKSLSEVQTIFAAEDDAELKDAADATNWAHVLTVVKSFGYEDTDFRCFWEHFQKFSSEIFLRGLKFKVNCRSRARFTFFLSTLEKLNFEAQPPVSYMNKGD